MAVYAGATIQPENTDIGTTGNTVSISFQSPIATAAFARRPNSLRKTAGSTSTPGITINVSSPGISNVVGPAPVAYYRLLAPSGLISLGAFVIMNSDAASFKLSETLMVNALNQKGTTVITAVIGFLKDAGAGIVSPGLRYCDPTTNKWTTTLPSQVAFRPVLLLHGIMSTVESTYKADTTCNWLRVNGAYDAVYGYDYNWLDKPANIAPQIVAAIANLHLHQLDIVAHSYGTIVALAVIPQLDIDQVQNLVLIGGPLNGSFAASPEVVATMIAVANPGLGLYSLGVAKTLSALDAAPFQIFIPGNADLKSIRSAFINNTNSAAPQRVIEIAGGTSFGSKEDAIIKQLYPGSVGTPYDGIVSKSSALDPAIAGKSWTGTFNGNLSYANPYVYATGIWNVKAGTMLHFEPKLTHVEMVNNQSVENGEIATDLNFVVWNGPYEPFSFNQPTYVKGVGSRVGSICLGTSDMYCTGTLSGFTASTVNADGSTNSTGNTIGCVPLCATATTYPANEPTMLFTLNGPAPKTITPETMTLSFYSDALGLLPSTGTEGPYEVYPDEPVNSGVGPTIYH